MFLVVEFLAEKSVAVVPKSWLHNDRCFWPASKSKRKTLVKKAQEPDPSWDLFAVRVLFEYSKSGHEQTICRGRSFDGYS